LDFDPRELFASIAKRVDYASEVPIDPTESADRYSL